MDDAALCELIGARSIEGLRRLSGGASRETWSADARDDDGSTRALIIHRDRPGGVAAGPKVPEGALLRAAARAGVPVPAVIGDAPGTLVTERIDGETIPRRILRDDTFTAARDVLVAQCGRALAALHTIDATGIEGLAGGDQIGQWRTILDATGEAHPAFELAFRWLEANRPAPHAEGLVHGDFRLGNLLIDGTGLRAVLDWELAHLGDPHEDLGWLCVRAWRFGAPHRVAGVGALDDLLDAYASVAGWRPDPDTVRWWEVLGTLKWGVMCILQASTHLTGAHRSVELATIGRRVCENEWDVLLLLAPEAELGATDVTGGPLLPEPSGPGLHGRPTAAELVEAVREFLEKDVWDATEGRVQFHTRVATNALKMVERELAFGAAQTRAHGAALERLGVADEAALADAIRTGALDDRAAEVFAVVRDAVRARLAVAHPGYEE